MASPRELPGPDSSETAGIAGGRLRAWQVEALRRYEAESPRRDFLVTATPGAGKTMFALTLAARLLRRRAIDRLIVVCPTDHLRTQWADAAARAGIPLDAALSNATGPVRPDLTGYVTTYAQVAAAVVGAAALFDVSSPPMSQNTLPGSNELIHAMVAGCFVSTVIARPAAVLPRRTNESVPLGVSTEIVASIIFWAKSL